VLEGLAQIALTQVYVTAQACLGEMRPCGGRFGWLVFGADYYAVTAGVVTYGSGQVERRNTIGRAGLDNPARIGRAAELIAEFRLVPVKGDKFVGAEGLYGGLGWWLRIGGALGVVAAHRRNLRVASGMQGSQQAFQFRIVYDAHGQLPSLV